MKTNPLKNLIFVFFLSAPGLLFASLIFFPSDGRKKRDNPADQRSTNYQGYATTSRDQVLVILNLPELAEGTAGAVNLSNAGWRPLEYQFSEEASFASAVWKAMPTNQNFSESHSGKPGNRVVYVKLKLQDKTERSFPLSFSYRIRSIYVNGSLGSETNQGTTPDSALKTLTNAYVMAVKSNFKTIYLATGVYNRVSGINTTGDGLIITNSNLKISGGWDSNFVTQTNVSIIDGQNVGPSRPILIGSVTNIELTRLYVTGGYRNGGGDEGGGLYITNSSYIVASNCGFYYNYAQANGGGIMILNSHHLAMSGTLVGNSNSPGGLNSGGGICVSNSHTMTLNFSMHSNISQTGCAASFRGVGCYGITLNALATTNSNYGFVGGIIAVTDPLSITIANTVITNNLMGHGIFLNSAASSQGSLVIRNCIFGIPTPQAGANNYYPIMEGPTDLTSHHIYNNYFITNNQTNIYRDGGGTQVITTPQFTQLNTPSDTFHDAGTSYGNQMVDINGI